MESNVNPALMQVPQCHIHVNLNPTWNKESTNALGEKFS